MVIKFNGKVVQIKDVSDEFFKIIINNIVKNASKSNLAECFGKAYRNLLVARLGKEKSVGSPTRNTNAGIASGTLVNSIKLEKVSIIGSKKDSYSATITMKHLENFGEAQGYGMILGAETFKKPLRFNDEAIARMSSWIRYRKGRGGDFAWANELSDKATARLILWSWYKNGKDRRVLPKWYDVFKYGEQGITPFLFKEKDCIQKQLKKMFNG